MKKRICFMMAVALCAMLLTACGNSSRQSGNADVQNQSGGSSIVQNTEPGKVLVVYYSASGNTKAVAETIAQYTNGDTFEIIPVDAYTEEDLNWA